MLIECFAARILLEHVEYCGVVEVSGDAVLNSAWLRFGVFIRVGVDAFELIGVLTVGVDLDVEVSVRRVRHSISVERTWDQA